MEILNVEKNISVYAEFYDGKNLVKTLNLKVGFKVENEAGLEWFSLPQNISVEEKNYKFNGDSSFKSSESSASLKHLKFDLEKLTFTYK